LIKDKGAVLFDAGLPRKINRFKRSLSRIPVDPSEINLVILSHAHFDQAGTAKDIRELKLSIQLTGVLFIRIK